MLYNTRFREGQILTAVEGMHQYITYILEVGIAGEGRAGYIPVIYIYLMHY